MKHTSTIHKILQKNGLRLVGFEDAGDGRVSPVVTDAQTGERFRVTPEKSDAADGFADMMAEINGKKAAEKKFRSEPPFITLIEDTGLKNRTCNLLKYSGIRTLGDLVGFTETDLLRVPSVGKSTIDDIKAAVGRCGLSLGMWENPTYLF